MKKSKIKILSLLLALILMSMTLGACGNETGGPDDVAEKEFIKKKKLKRKKKIRKKKFQTKGFLR